MPTFKPELNSNIVFKHDYRELSLADEDLGICGREGCCGNDFIFADYNIDKVNDASFLRNNSEMREKMDNPNEIDDGDKILLPFYAFGFVLRSRRWVQFAVDLLEEIEYTDGWNKLQLPDGHRETVLALVQNYSEVGDSGGAGAETFAMDLVESKGKGLILLLHGEPGVGKTSTAECVADYTKRPLFQITCGDIGNNANDVEWNMERNFQLAHRWGCVLLLDEADVFLQQRNKEDLERNSIVSVFLRTLEYYSGILFLTTNRIGIIDPAFKSRIHLSLYYPKLNWPKTKAIWENHLSRLSKLYKKNKKMKIDRGDILLFAKEHYNELLNSKPYKKGKPWNGRQIRNAFQTAVALAEYNASNSASSSIPGPILNRKYFQQVAKTSREFDEYLKSTWGSEDEEDRSRRNQERIDSFSSPHLQDSGLSAPKKPLFDTPNRDAAGKKPRSGKAAQYEEEVDNEESSGAGTQVEESDEEV